jgi:hypothetical protein
MSQLLLIWMACSGPVDTDRDGFADGEDCAPEDSSSHPGAWEVCDGVDNDCDGEVDEGYDLDGDGYLADDAGCRMITDQLDCNDLDAAIHPGATETCDGRDEDCNGIVDDAVDADQDGYGACEDCDDSDAFLHPEAAEACDGLDNDCDGGIDEDWDADGDGVAGCFGDCDDNDPARSPDTPEACDGLDNDCDDIADEGFDEDLDGWLTCEGDCDDSNDTVFPGADEICDGLDNDCDPTTSEDEDIDGDGLTLCDGDCNDRDATAFPGAEEICDGVDNDCNGLVDEYPECWGCTLDSELLVCSDAVTRNVALDACTDLGLSLVIAPTFDDNMAISEVAGRYLAAPYWIDLDDSDEEGVWVWGNGETLTYDTAWSPGEPNDYGGEDCVHANWDGLSTWNDIPCSATYPFVCQP